MPRRDTGNNREDKGKGREGESPKPKPGRWTLKGLLSKQPVDSTSGEEASQLPANQEGKKSQWTVERRLKYPFVPNQTRKEMLKGEAAEIGKDEILSNLVSDDAQMHINAYLNHMEGEVKQKLHSGNLPELRDLQNTLQESLNKSLITLQKFETAKSNMERAKDLKNFKPGGTSEQLLASSQIKAEIYKPIHDQVTETHIPQFEKRLFGY